MQNQIAATCFDLYYNKIKWLPYLKGLAGSADSYQSILNYEVNFIMFMKILHNTNSTG
jgi:hypothetical protein